MKHLVFNPGLDLSPKQDMGLAPCHSKGQSDKYTLSKPDKPKSRVHIPSSFFRTDENSVSTQVQVDLLCCPFDSILKVKQFG